jgi:Suppressor of fused protein (SUFU)
VHAGTLGDIAALSRSWAFELLNNAARSVAEQGGILSRLGRNGILSMEFPGVSQSHSIGAQLPERFVTADDCVGILLGVPVTGFPTRIDDMPLSPVSIVPVTLITAEELEALRHGGRAAREALAERIAQTGRHHLSNL